MSAHLFVYGTLLSGAQHPMHRRLTERATLRGPASFSGRLYRVKHYPGVVPSGHPDDRVHGELYALHDAHKILATLDDYEGCGPAATKPTRYVRELRKVHLDDGSTVAAWIYLYNLPVAGLSRIASGRFLETGGAERTRAKA